MNKKINLTIGEAIIMAIEIILGAFGELVLLITIEPMNELLIMSALWCVIYLVAMVVLEKKIQEAVKKDAE